MFTNLQELADSLPSFEEGIKENKYVAVKDARKVLQEIKVEAQKMRQTLSEKFKASRIK